MKEEHIKQYIMENDYDEKKYNDLRESIRAWREQLETAASRSTSASSDNSRHAGIAGGRGTDGTSRVHDHAAGDDGSRGSGEVVTRGGQVACRRYSQAHMRHYLFSGWRRTSLGSVPIRCKSLSCRQCGKEQRNALIARNVEAYRRHKIRRLDVITLTFRTKRRHETWLDCYRRLGQCITTARSYWSNRQWRTYISRCLAEFTKKLNISLYWYSIELTKQDVPHIHMTVPRLGSNHRALNSILYTTWKKIVPDAGLKGAMYGGRKGILNRPIGDAVIYAGKYLTKGFTTAQSIQWKGVHRHGAGRSLLKPQLKARVCQRLADGRLLNPVTHSKTLALARYHIMRYAEATSMAHSDRRGWHNDLPTTLARKILGDSLYDRWSKARDDARDKPFQTEIVNRPLQRWDRIRVDTDTEMDWWTDEGIINTLPRQPHYILR